MSTIDEQYNDAKRRLRKAIDSMARNRRALIRDMFRPPQKEAQQVLTLTIRDRDHFYKVVNWCNDNIGKGSQYWTVRGRVLRFIDPTKEAYKPPAIRDWGIFVPGVDFTPVIEM